jgi:hypothetical protein
MNTVLDLSEFRMRCKTMSGGSWIKLLEHYADPAIDLEPGKDYMELNPVTNRFRVRYYSYSGHFVRDTSCNYYEVIRKLGYRVQEGDLIITRDNDGDEESTKRYIIVSKEIAGHRLGEITAYPKFVVKRSTSYKEDIQELDKGIFSCIPNAIKPIKSVRCGDIYICNRLDIHGFPTIREVNKSWTFDSSGQHKFITDLYRYKIKRYVQNPCKFSFFVNPAEEILFSRDQGFNCL